MISPGGLFLGLAVAAPTLWGALMRGTVPVDVAMQRLVLILAVTAIGWGLLESLVRGFVRSASRSEDRAPQQERRRASDR